jgi:hypothetical protein
MEVDMRLQGCFYLATALRRLGRDDEACRVETAGRDELLWWQAQADAGLVRPPLVEALALPLRASANP